MQPSSLSSDTRALSAAVVLRIQNGDSRARAELYDLLRQRLNSQLRRQPREIREDLARHAFAATISEIESGRLTDEAAVLAFAARTSRRRIAELRAERAACDGSQASQLESPEPDQPRCDTAEESERVAAMADALRALRPADLELLRRYYELRQSPAEICGSLGITDRQFRLRKRHARARLMSQVERSMRSRSKGQAV